MNLITACSCADWFSLEGVYWITLTKPLVKLELLRFSGLERVSFQPHTPHGMDDTTRADKETDKHHE